MKIACPHCTQRISYEPAATAFVGECPTCGGDLSFPPEPPPIPSRRPPPTPLIAKLVLGWFFLAAICFLTWAYVPGVFPERAPREERTAPAPWTPPPRAGLRSAIGSLWIGTRLYEHGRHRATVRAFEKQRRDGEMVPMVQIEYVDGPTEWKTRATITKYFLVEEHQLVK